MALASAWKKERKKERERERERGKIRVFYVEVWATKRKKRQGEFERETDGQ